MRRLSMVLACVTVALANQPGVARPLHGDRFDFGKPDTTNEQFRQDRNACVAEVIATVRHSSRADRRRYCQINNASPPNPGYASQGPNYNGIGTSPDENRYRYQYQSSPNYDYADRLFMKCMREKGYSGGFAGTTASTTFHAGPLWR